MRRRYVNYNLEHGFIDNWLVAGPQRITIDLEQTQGEFDKAQITQQYFQPSSEITTTPVERGPLDKGRFKIADFEGSWEYQACGEDHQIDLSTVLAEPNFLRSWAYTQLSCKTAQEVTFVLYTHGPADLWLNGEHIHRHEHFYEQDPVGKTFNVNLKKGINKILVRFEAVGTEACPYALALQVCKLLQQREPYPARSGIHVTIPTLIEGITRRNKLERAFRIINIRQDVFEPQDQIRLYWPEDLADDTPAVIRLQTHTGQIHAEATVDGTAGDEVFLNFPIQIPAGPYRIRMLPLSWEFYERDMRITHEIPIWNLGRQAYAGSPSDTYTDRRQEALSSAFTGNPLAEPVNKLFAEIAKMALDQWATVDPEIIAELLPNIGDLELVGLLGMVYRFGDHTQFHPALLEPIEETVLNFPYNPPTKGAVVRLSAENDEFLSSTAELLAGQRYTDQEFSVSGQTGQWHRQNGEEQIFQLLHSWGAYGFSAWDSYVHFARYLVALSHLVDLAESQSLRELSMAMMDKLFTTIAINSHQGVFGSTHGQTRASFVKGGLLEPTSGITRLMWGTGVFNHHIAGTVSLACTKSYELPDLLSKIALADPPEIWSRERHLVGAETEVNKVTYRTPEAMLCSAQDYRPGEKGRSEHIWQATLGGSAAIFVNHPACASENDARQPNFWAGNAVLPRVAQWKDLLIAVHQLVKESWMGFTHAYFPIYAFDEYALKDGWAFARKGQGYLALTASQELELVHHGKYAFRELRSYGMNNIWLCQLGNQRLDGAFSVFQEKVLAMPVTFEQDSVRCTSLRDEVLSFGWEAPFTRNGEEQPLSGFDHYENPFVAAEYPCEQMDIAFGEDLLRLNFEKTAGSQPT